MSIDIDRTAAARYGITVEDIQNEIEVALAGRAVTYTWKSGSLSGPHSYARADRNDEESIRRLLISPGICRLQTRRRLFKMGEALRLQCRKRPRLERMLMTPHLHMRRREGFDPAECCSQRWALLKDRP